MHTVYQIAAEFWKLVLNDMGKTMLSIFFPCRRHYSMTSREIQCNICYIVVTRWESQPFIFTIYFVKLFCSTWVRFCYSALALSPLTAPHYRAQRTLKAILCASVAFFALLNLSKARHNSVTLQSLISFLCLTDANKMNKGNQVSEVDSYQW